MLQYRKFVANFAQISRPLHNLCEKAAKIEWSLACEESLQSLKQSLMSSPILAYPMPDKTFILDTNASNKSTDDVLSQEHCIYEQSYEQI